MGQTNTSCSCANDDYKEQLENYEDLPGLTKEDVQQIWKCFEYLEPKNGIVPQSSLLKTQKTSPLYMNEIVSSLLMSHDDITFEDFFKIMKPMVLKQKSSGSVLMESNSTNVSCLICPYHSKSN